MDPTAVSSPSQKKPNQLQGPRPSALKLNPDSHKIKKPPLPPQRLNPNRVQPQQPVIIYAVSPKVIHTNESEFMAVVQRLTGLSSSDFAVGPSGSLSPAARLAATERASPMDGNPRAVTALDSNSGEDEFRDLMDGVDLGQLPSILSPAPAMLPSVPPGFFSPSDPYALSFLSDFVLSPCGPSGGNSFTVSPGRFSPLASPDFFNFLRDL